MSHSSTAKKRSGRVSRLVTRHPPLFYRLYNQRCTLSTSVYFVAYPAVFASHQSNQHSQIWLHEILNQPPRKTRSLIRIVKSYCTQQVIFPCHSQHGAVVHCIPCWHLSLQFCRICSFRTILRRSFACIHPPCVRSCNISYRAHSMSSHQTAGHSSFGKDRLPYMICTAGHQFATPVDP